jgi:hypothetical protein
VPGLIWSSEVDCNNKNRCPWYIIKKHFLFFVFTYFIFFFFAKKPQRMYSIFIHSSSTPGNPFTISFLFVSECPVRKYMYIMYCVWTQCNCSKMRHFFSEGQKHKTTEGWRPKVVSMETVFFLLNFIFYRNDNTF